MTTGGGKKMGLVGASSLVVANMVGTGLFLLPSSLANVGSISILGWIAAAIGATALGLVFAYLGMVDPKPGGPYAYARDHLGAFPAFQTNMLYWIANVIGNVAIAVSVTGYLATFFPVLKSTVVANVTTAAILWLFVWLNTRDASAIGKFTTVSTIAGILPIAFVGLLGWFWFQPDVFRASWNPEALPTYTAIERSASIALWAFLGVESAAVSAGVIENPSRNVPLATVIGLLLSTVIYISCCTVLMGIIPGEHLRVSGAPFSEAASMMLGPWAGVVIALAAILKASGSLVGWILIVAQSAQAAAQDGMFPKRFGWTNARGMPVQNLVITGVMMTLILVATASPDVATQFSSITDATVVLMSLPYIYSVVAMWRLSRIVDSGSARARFLVVAGIIACMYCVSVVLGQSDRLGRNALIVLLATVPLYALIRVTKRDPSETRADV